MPWVMNSRDEDVRVRVFGNDFSFKPKQIKQIFSPHMASFLTIDRRDEGFVGLPEEAEELEWRNSPEGKAYIEEKRKEGIANYCTHLRTIVYNMEVSLKQDLDKANIKADPRVFASKGEIEAYKQLLKYQDRSEDEDQKRIDEVKELQKKLKA